MRVGLTTAQTLADLAEIPVRLRGLHDRNPVNRPRLAGVQIELPPFTLVGATTRLGLLTTPLRERFGINLRLEFYGPDDLATIVTRGAGLLDLAMTDEGAVEIARRARGTPRIAGRLLR
ncbi:MAG: hypothetical protein EBS22_09960, partial [Acidimicrobiia bacterium]|nr:hypothetical protein [Acidimicrobiia bacterium]